MALEGERYPAPVTEQATRRRRRKRLLIAFALLLVLIIVVHQLDSIIDPTRIYQHG